MRASMQFVAVAIVVAISATNSVAEVIYVKAAAPPGGDSASWAAKFFELQDGKSWDTAFTDLQDGLAVATPGSGDQLWVAAGIYKPTGPGGDRAISFNLVSGTAIYGGFDGTETKLEERDPAVNITILSGDLSGNDVGDAIDPSHTENSYHVVRAATTAAGTIIDGVTITSGYANGVSPDTFGAGAMLEGAVVEIVNCNFTTHACRSGGCGVSVRNGGAVSITDSLIAHNRPYAHASQQVGIGLFAVHTTISMTRCEISDNFANPDSTPGTTAGGGMLISASNLNISECLFETNYAYQSGAFQIQNQFPGSPSTGVVSKCRFIDNMARHGGGLINFTTVSIVDCQFISNQASFSGGGAVSITGSTFINCLFAGNEATSLGGGIALQNAQPQLINCVFTGNKAASGGALRGTTSLTLLQNCTIAYNTASETCGGVFLDGPSMYENCVLWGNSDSNGTGEDSQLIDTPFVNYTCVQGWTGSIGGIGSFGLDPLFVDADGADNIPGTEDDDLRVAAGSPCINRGDPAFVPSFDFDFVGQPRIQECLIDLGAFETADDDPLLPDCNMNGVQDPCDIAAMTSIDCNLNIVPDECDIVGGTSADKNGNGVPDECDDCPADVNDNGIVNIADLLLVISNWGQTGVNPADVNGDSVVNIIDLLTVIAAWGPC